MKKILIVEDDPVVGRVYSSYLQRGGFEVKLAKDGAEGVEQLREFKPEGVLLDVMLPKVNGFEILKIVRADSELQSIPVIIYSNALVPAVMKQAKEAGASYVFDKSTMTPTQLVNSFKDAGLD